MRGAPVLIVKLREGAALMGYSPVLSESSQGTQMGISHEAREAHPLTDEGRKRGHRAL